jgi:hypothetical protein
MDPKTYARRWKELGPILDRLRDQEIRNANTAEAIQMFDTAFQIAQRDLPERTTCGLVEWQRAMALWRRKLGR